MTPHDLIAAFEDVAEAPDGVERLRELVLQLAVRGKLVPQDPADEPASVLLERIAAEKARLVKAGEIREPTKLPPVPLTDVRFDVPESWEWVRLGRYCFIEMGQSPPSAHYNRSGDGLPFFQGKADFGAAYPTPRYWCTEPTKIARPGDVLLSVRAPVGPTNVADVHCCIGRGLAALRPLGATPTRHLFWTVRAFAPDLEALGTGTTFVAISRGSIDPFFVPIPPLAEQHRIVARVDELMNLLDRLEAARTTRDVTRAAVRDSSLDALREADTPDEVEVAWNRFAERMDDLLCDPADITPLRQAVLQLAVRGRLVAQDPDDEPANVLLERIAAEKTRMVKAGEIRKQESLPPIPENESPFAAPASWVWSTLDDLVDPERQVSYGVLVPGPEVEGGTPLVRVADLFTRNPPVRPEKSIAASVAAQYDRVRLRGDELLVGVVGSIGKIGVARPEWAGAVVARAVVRFGVIGMLMRDFILVALQSPAAQSFFRDAARTLAQPTLNVGQLRRLPVPVPPLAEQRRIVARVDELMSLLDQLEERLTTARTVHGAFAAAAVHHLDA